MSDSTLNVIIGVIGMLSNVLIYLQLKKRHDITMAETRKVNALEVEETRHKNQVQENTKFNSEIEKLKLAIVQMNKKIEEFKAGITESVTALHMAEIKYTETQKKADKLYEAFKEYEIWAQTKFRFIDSKHLEYDANFGKIILKE